MEEAENGVRNRSLTRAPGNGVRKLSPPPTREDGVRNRSLTRATGNGVRKLSPPPTREDAPEQTMPSASPPPPRIPRWLILDTIIHRCSRRHCGVVEDDATASELALDCAGRPIRASLRIADPPAVSRLYLHQTGRPAICIHEPTAIAAHCNSILFQITVPFDDPMWWHDSHSFPIDYFVYTCRSSSPPQSLTLLPPCFDGGHIDPELDKFCKPHRQQRLRCMVPEDMGILCHGDQGEFTVAEITFSKRYEVELCLLHNPPPAGSSMEWNVKKLQFPPDTKINTYLWMTDAVLPIGTCLCWVDNYQGILLIDVLAKGNSNPDHQQWLRYIPLPKKALKSQRLYKDAGEPDPLRSVCVTDTGIIKLVCVLTELPPFTIKAWTLDIYEGRWTMDLNTTMGANEFFSLLGTGHNCPPRVQPSFPLVSLVDPDVICFLLKDKDNSLFWMIDVNMKDKKLHSSALYISEEEEEDGYPPKRGRRNDFFGHCFIPSKFSSYLSEGAITSWELSEKMQEAKKERVMQKIGLEAKLKK